VTRDKVYKAIDSEREHQIRRWGIDQPDGKAEFVKPPECYMTYARRYLARAEAAITADDLGMCLIQLRKVAALLVCCFEQHGVPERINDVRVSDGPSDSSVHRPVHH
jgi:hypothetical protein